MVTVDGSDPNGNASTWTNSSTLTVGDAGIGTLTIQNGGKVSNTSGIIAFDPNSTGMVTVDGSDANGNVSTWTNSGNLRVGNSGDGSLAIQNGGEVSTSIQASIGLFSGSTGAATVSGSDPNGNASTWTISFDLFVGASGDGTLEVTNGGTVSNTIGYIGLQSGSTGTVTVDGADSTWTNTVDLFLGGDSFTAGGAGSLTVQNQGLVDVDGTLKIWIPGTVTINGGTIALDALDIEPGGTMAFNFGTLNYTSNLSVAPSDSLETALGGSHTVSFGQALQVDGTTTLNNVLTVGGGTFSTNGLINPQLLQFNTGTLQLTGAGGLTVGAAGLFGSSLSIGAGQNLEVTNTLTVDAGATLSLSSGGNISAGAVSNSGQLHGSGTLAGPLTNNAGGEVQGLAGKNLILTGSGNTNNGQVTLSGGQVHFTQDFINSTTGLVIGNGTLRADGGTTNDGDMAFSAAANVIGDVTNNATGVIISAGGTTTFFDDVTNNGEIRTNENSFSVYFGSYSGNGDTGTGTVIMEGDLKPGSSPGIMAFAGDLSFGPAAGLDIELGGLVAGSEYDQVTVADTASLAGMLNVSLIDGFSPTAGDTFDIITASAVLGTFDVETLPTLGGALQFLVDYQPTGVSLLVGLAGDFDFDGDVDGFDFLAWQRGESPNPLSQSDLNDWETNYGTVAPLVPTSAAVPEPSTVISTLSAMMALLLLRDRGWRPDSSPRLRTT